MHIDPTALARLQTSLAQEEALMLRLELLRRDRAELLRAAGVPPGSRLNPQTGEVTVPEAPPPLAAVPEAPAPVFRGSGPTGMSEAAE